MNSKSGHKHFAGKDAIQHVVEAQSQGVIAEAESHGAEMPGHISAGADAARETAIILSLVCLTLTKLGESTERLALVLGMIGITWLCWRFGRSAWLGWSRLERLHRVVEEERYEIQHHRQQEREELTALYAAKGFEGQLLEDVIDVLMSDNDRLLRVMLEEELGLQLEVYEHPLKQGLGAAVGVLAALSVAAATLFIIPPYGLVLGSLVTLGLAAAVAAKYEGNRLIPSVLWNVALGVLTFGIVTSLLDFVLAAQ